MFAAAASPAKAVPPPDIDKFVGDVMQRFGVPGMSVAIVEGEQTTHAKAYGVRGLDSQLPANEHTVFPIGSETKAFTAAALAILVDRGKLKWSDRVVDRLPGFRMYDPYATANMTVRDLLTHRSGLGLGQGDLMIVPNTDRSRKDIVRALRYLKPKTGFRDVFAYDNILYIVAGELVEAVARQGWEDFVRQNIFSPAGMTDAIATDFKTSPNHISLHARTDGAMRGLGTQRVLEAGLDPRVMAPAGAINASAEDMANWMGVLIGNGKARNGTQVFSAEALEEMWKPVVVVSERGFPIPEIQPVIESYALGWFVHDYRGHRIITHSGAVLGGLAVMAIIPEKHVGISVAINSEDSIARWSVFYHLLDHYLDMSPTDWPTRFEDVRGKMVSQALEAMKAQPEQVNTNTNFTLPLAAYSGTYRDPWYGTMTVSHAAKGLRIRFDRTPGMEGALEPIADDMFRTRWTDSSIEDAYVSFSFGKRKRMSKVTMRAISPLADFSFDYQDLEFVPAR